MSSKSVQPPRNILANSKSNKDPRQLVDSIINAYGGLDRYSSLSRIDVKFDFTGATLGLKGRHTHLSPRASVSTTEQKVVYHGLGGAPDEAWIFTPSRVYKQRPDGTVIDSRDSPREAFAGHTLETPWDDFHFLYANQRLYCRCMEQTANFVSGP